MDMRWIEEGEKGEEVEVKREKGMEDEMRRGEIIDRMEVMDEEKREKRFVDFIREKRFEEVFVNVIYKSLEKNIVRYIKEDIMSVMIVKRIKKGKYEEEKEIRDNVKEKVGV